MKLTPVILIGGSGTRLWPLSRQHNPKQFIKFDGEHSLFQQTCLRVQQLQNIDQFIFVVGEDNYFLCLDQLNELNIKKYTIIVEPLGRNTAAAIAAVAMSVDADANLLVLPADHKINNSADFAESIKQVGVGDVQEHLILFGIKPTAPATAYGYIQAKSDAATGSIVERFIEKPNLEKAKELIKQDCIYWNSGIFLFKASVVLNQINTHAAEIADAVAKAVDQAYQSDHTIRLEKINFSACPNEPIDIAVLEKTDKAFLFELNSDWSDMGDWLAIYEAENKDDNHNAIVGEVITLDSQNNYFYSPDKLLTAIGVDNLIVVAAKDSLLIADKSRTQDVKKLVTLLKESDKQEVVLNDLKVFRPWGSYETVKEGHGCKVKHIVVKPGGKLSLQSHQHRSEHWVVISGIADIVNGDKTLQVHPNESTYIPKQTKHRLLNLQTEPLHLIEVQVGDYVGEDDIERFDDVYGRTPATASEI